MDETGKIERFWAVVSNDRQDKPLALFASEHAAWAWALSRGGDRPNSRGRFAVAPDDLQVVVFTVSAVAA